MTRENEYSDAQMMDAGDEIDAATAETEESAAAIAAPDELEEMEESAAMPPAPDDETATPPPLMTSTKDAEEIADNIALSSIGALMVPEDDPAIEIVIATNTNVRNKTGWINIYTPFDSFEKRFIQPVRSTVSAENYHKKSKTEQGRIKSAAGGFVGGELKGHQRNNDAIVNRILWNGDIDACPAEIFEKFKRAEGVDFRGFMYTTFSHLPEAPRVRLIAPLSRPVTPDEYTELSPFICLKIEHANKCKLFDEHGNSPAQLMYNAYAPKDGDYFFKDFRGAVLDVDALFEEMEQHGKEYAEEMAALLHVDATEITRAAPKAKTKSGKRPQDPRKRDGIPGVFNRAYYPIQKAINKFLPHIYKQEAPDRFTYIEGSAANGLSIMDDLRAYAWDATNTAVNNGHALDAWDIVTAHLYGDNDKAARAELKNDGGVKRQIFEERRRKVEAEYLDFPEDDEAPDIWKEKLRVDDNERYLPTPDNCTLILENDPLFKNIAYNDMADREEITGPVPWARGEGAGKLFDETDRAELLVLIDKVYECDFTDRALDSAIKAVTNRRRFHPFRQFLESLPAWDGRKRTAEILPRAFDVPATDYTTAVMRKTLCAIIKRTYHPGCEFNYVPVLDGEQGIGKTSFLKWLVGIDFYNGGITFEKMRSKSAAEDMQGYALAEFQELDGLNKVEARTARSFITETKDVYRAPYDRKAKEHLRKCVFWGTVNGFGGYLRDPEGNRRMWPLKCRRKAAQGRAWDKFTNENYRLQLWAEAMAAYKFGEVLTMDNDPALARAALEAQNAAIEIDTRAGLVERYLSLHYPAGWDIMSISERIAWLNSDFKAEGGAPATGVLKEKVCAMEIYREAWQGEAVRMSSKDRDDIRRIMAKVPGWEPITEGRPRFPGYGQSQPAWRRVGNFDKAPAPDIEVKDDDDDPFADPSALSVTTDDAAKTPAAVTYSHKAAANARINFPPREDVPPAPSKRDKQIELYNNAEIDVLRSGARGMLEFIKESGRPDFAGDIDRIDTAERSTVIAIIIDAENFAASCGKDFEKAAREARAAGFRRAYSVFLKQRRAEEAATAEPVTIDPAELDVWRLAARTITAHLTAEKQARSAGEIVTRYTQNGINNAELVAVQNIVRDALEFAREIGWGFGNAAGESIRSALAGAPEGEAAGKVLKALGL